MKWFNWRTVLAAWLILLVAAIAGCERSSLCDRCRGCEKKDRETASAFVADVRLVVNHGDPKCRNCYGTGLIRRTDEGGAYLCEACLQTKGGGKCDTVGHEMYVEDPETIVYVPRHPRIRVMRDPIAQKANK